MGVKLFNVGLNEVYSYTVSRNLTKQQLWETQNQYAFVCVCVRACVRACVRECVRACVSACVRVCGGRGSVRACVFCFFFFFLFSERL